MVPNSWRLMILSVISHRIWDLCLRLNSVFLLFLPPVARSLRTYPRAVSPTVEVLDRTLSMETAMLATHLRLQTTILASHKVQLWVAKICTAASLLLALHSRKVIDYVWWRKWLVMEAMEAIQVSWAKKVWASLTKITSLKIHNLC